MKTQYINYTPIPPQVPRQLAIEILQSHGEIITTNPLVLDYHPIKAPRDCPNDEYYSTWYEITERIQFVPGLKKLGSSKVSFKGCFHDMPWGVQTHMYVPMGVDLRNKWQIKGSQPGDPPEPRELGSGAPSSGLYLREEVEIKCNPMAVSFIKKEMKAAALVMVERMIKKAELLDAGVLQAMFENGKLKTYNPADRSQAPPPMSPQPSPGIPDPTRWRPDSMRSESTDQRMSTYSSYSQSAQHPPREGPNQLGQIPQPGGKGFAVEMPGDFLYPAESVNQNKTSDRYSQTSGSDQSPVNRNSRWSFVSGDNHSNSGTPGLQQNAPQHAESNGFAAELPGSGHKNYEANKPGQVPPQPQPQQQRQQQQQKQQQTHQTYNPQNYARFSGNGYA